MDEEKQYQDIDGNPCTLDILCRREPAWAANRLRAAQAEVARLESELAQRADSLNGCAKTLATEIHAKCGYRDRAEKAEAEVARLTAENEALRREVEDVRFLDEWAKGAKALEWSMTDCTEQVCCALETTVDGGHVKSTEYYGAKPTSARRAAVEFIKKQNASTTT